MMHQTIVAITCIICITQSQPIYSGSAEFNSFFELDHFGSVSIAIDYGNDVVNIIFSGYDPVWNGIGFGEAMNNTYAIVIDYGEVEEPVFYETILGDHNAGVYIDGVIEVIEDTTEGYQRSVHMVRPINADSYSFPSNPGTSSMEIPMIAALGTSIGFYLPEAAHRAYENFTLILKRSDTTSAPLITSTETASTAMETTKAIVTTIETTTESASTAMETTEAIVTTIETTAEVDVCCDCLSKTKYSQMKHSKPWFHKPWKYWKKYRKSAGCEEDATCENIICERDPYCCNKGWDKICRIQAERVCSGEELPKCCGCTYKMNEKVIGCVNDEECEEEICSNDAFCCGEDEKGRGYWDHKCRKQAHYICKTVGAEENYQVDQNE